MKDISVTADVSGRLTLVRLVAPRNMLDIFNTADVLERLTLVRLVAS